MRKLILCILPCTVFLGCQPENEPSDVANRASGTYAVQFYVEDGDTLYSTSGKNKLGVNNFYIGISRKSSDTVAVSYARNIGSLYVGNPNKLPLGGARIVRIDEVNGNFRLSNGTRAPFIYESTINGTRFYERTTGYNVDSLEARWRFDSLKSPYNPPIKEIIISAQK